MSETRRMHFVPRTYLKRFARKKKGGMFINVLDKENGKLFEGHINNICVEKDIYSLDGLKGIDGQFLEMMYNVLYEKGYDELYNTLIDENRNELTPREHYSIIGFVVSMFYRNSIWNKNYFQFMDNIFAQGYQIAKHQRQSSFYIEKDEIVITGKSLEQLQKEYKKKDAAMIALTSAQKSFQLTRLRLERDIVTITKVDSDYQFITSDNPVGYDHETHRRNAIPFDPTNTLSIPIDDKHLLQLRPWASDLERKKIWRLNEPGLLGAVQVSMNNIFQRAQSGKFLLGTESAIKRVIDKPFGIIPPERAQA